MPSRWIPIVPIPADALESRPSAHLVRGRPKRTFDFYDDRGIVGYLYRFEGSDGTPRDLPLCWCVDESGRTEWRWQSFEQPRPLYGYARLLLAKQEAVVVVTDDPACVDVGYQHLPGYAFVAYLGGLNGIKKTSWKGLTNRKVLVWPSADTEVAKGALAPLKRAEQPLMRAAKQIATQLVKADCEVKIIVPPEPGDVDTGFNLAMAVAKGWSAGDTIAWMDQHCQTIFSRTTFGYQSKPPPTPQGAGARGDDWRRQARLILNRGEIADCRENVIEFLSKHPAWHRVLAWDEFAYRVVKLREPPYGGGTGEWTDHDHIALGQWLAHEEGLVVRSVDTIARAVTFVAEANTVHPVRQYLRSLEWDKIERLHLWLHEMLGVSDSEYARIAGPMILMNLVARVMEPGCIMRVVPVLIGPQLKGKSTALQVLGGEWFADSMFVVGDKDAYQNLRGKWLYEISEFHSFGRAEATRVKAFVSSRQDTFRASYGMSARDWKRQVCFFATSNKFEIFTDITGSTRFWPFEPGKVGEIRLDLLAQLRDQLFAEAVVRWQRGDRRYPSPEQERDHFATVQERHEVQHPWFTKIREHCQTRWLSGNRRTSVNECLELLGIEMSKVSATTSETLTIVSILQRLGCEKQREGGGSRDYYYAIPETVVYQPKGPAQPEKPKDPNDTPF